MKFDVPRETLAELEQYVQLLVKWNAKINLIGKTTQSEIWDRHIWDSYQLLSLVPRETTSLVDLGSGAGLPGLIIAIARPDIAVTLVERDTRKASFLREAVRSLGLPKVRVVQDDAKNLVEIFDIVTARALAPLAELFGFTVRLMGKGAICLFPKGENFAREITEAKESWDFVYQVIHSSTNDKAGIISVTELKSAG